MGSRIKACECDRLAKCVGQLASRSLGFVSLIVVVVYSLDLLANRLATWPVGRWPTGQNRR
jgi:hypothetical protein